MKIVLIGAGSFVFAPSLLYDAIVDHRLADSELALVDLDADLANAMAAVGQRMAQEVGVSIRIWSTTARRQALPAADFVILCAEVQGARRWSIDFEILKRWGIPDQARECGGVGGLGKSMRTIPLALEVARDMEQLCPRAWLLDVTNPMPRIVTAVTRHTTIRALGFCNVAWGGYPGYQWLARLVGRSAQEIDVITAGLNHFAWLLMIRDRTTGEDLYPQVEAAVRQGASQDLAILRRWLDRYGGIGVSGPTHMADFLPPDPDFPYRVTPPYHGTPEERQRRIAQLRAIAAGEGDWRPLLEHRSWERPLDLAVAQLNRREATFDMLNLPNDGALAQLPLGRVVEVPAVVRDGVVSGRAVPPLPSGVAEICRAVSDVNEAVADAVATRDRALAEHALAIDPAVSDLDAARGALAEMIEAHADIVPPLQ